MPPGRAYYASDLANIEKFIYFANAFAIKPVHAIYTMSSTAKKNKSKTLSIRLYDEAYDFIEKRAKESKITKSNFLLSQIDPKSEFVKFLDSDYERIEREHQELKDEYAAFKKAAREQLTSILEESDDKTVIFLYKDDHDPETKRIFQKVAKKRGITLPD